MMIFNSFTIAIYNFGAQWPNGRGRRFLLPKNKTFEAFVQLLQGNFFKKELWFLFVLKAFCKKDY